MADFLQPKFLALVFLCIPVFFPIASFAFQYNGHLKLQHIKYSSFQNQRCDAKLLKQQKLCVRKQIDTIVYNNFNGNDAIKDEDLKMESKKASLISVLDAATNLFPCWVLFSALVGYRWPSLFTWFTGNLITMALAFTMLFMGMTLTVEDFQATLRNPRVVFLGVAAQYGIMPFLGWLVSKAFRMPSALAAGIILVGCCPGGTASNLVALIAQADVALSVMMTSASTLTAAVATPLLTKLLVGSLVPISGKDLLLSTTQVVLAPVAAGLALNTVAPKVSKAVSPFTPLVSVLIVALICGSVVASNAAMLACASIGKPLVTAVALLHLGGFALGYFCTKAFGQPEKTARTVSIEVGMQNSALAVVLATKAISDPSSSLPGAISATCHSLLGSALAGFWRSLKKNRNDQAIKREGK